MRVMHVLSGCSRPAIWTCGRRWRGPRSLNRRALRVSAAIKLPDVEEIDPYKRQEFDTPEIHELKESCREIRDAELERFQQLQSNAQETLDNLDQLSAQGPALAWLAGKMRGMVSGSFEEATRAHQQLLEEYRREHAAALRKAYMLQDPEFVEAVAAQAALETEEAVKEMVATLGELKKPSSQASIVAGTSLVVAAAVTGIGSLFGLQAATQLVFPPDASPQSLGSEFAMWTIPYMAATLAYYSLVNTGGDYRVFRMGLSPKDMSQLSLPVLGMVAFAVSLAQCTVYQGMWQYAVFSYLGAPIVTYSAAGVQELLRPAKEVAATGALVDTRALPFLVAVPLAAAVVGAVEAAGSAAMRNSFASLTPEITIVTNGEAEDVSAGFSFQEPGLPVPEPGAAGGAPAVDEDYWLTAVRVGVSGAWLAAETALTGSLWLAIMTSWAGLLVGAAVARSQVPPDVSGKPAQGS